MILDRVGNRVMFCSGAVFIEIGAVVTALEFPLIALYLFQHSVGLAYLTLISFLDCLILVRNMVEDVCVVVQVDMLHGSIMFCFFLINIIIVHFFLFLPAAIDKGITFLNLSLQIIHDPVFGSHCLPSLSVLQPLHLFLFSGLY